MKFQLAILISTVISIPFYLDYTIKYVSDGFYYKWQFAEVSSHDIKLYVFFILWGMFIWWGMGKIKGKIKSW